MWKVGEMGVLPCCQEIDAGVDIVKYWRSFTNSTANESVDITNCRTSDHRIINRLTPPLVFCE